MLAVIMLLELFYIYFVNVDSLLAQGAEVAWGGQLRHDLDGHIATTEGAAITKMAVSAELFDCRQRKTEEEKKDWYQTERKT